MSKNKKFFIIIANNKTNKSDKRKSFYGKSEKTDEIFRTKNLSNIEFLDMISDVVNRNVSEINNNISKFVKL